MISTTSGGGDGEKIFETTVPAIEIAKKTANVDGDSDDLCRALEIWIDCDCGCVFCVSETDDAHCANDVIPVRDLSDGVWTRPAQSVLAMEIDVENGSAQTYAR